MSAGAAVMGRPKKVATTGENRAVRETVIHLKGSPEFVDWLEVVNKKTHISKAEIVRIALAEWAEKNGHPLPPEI